MKATVQLRKKRQVTIPRTICELLDVKEEDILELDVKKIPKFEESRIDEQLSSK